MKIVFYPEIEVAADLNDCLARAAWYFSPYLHHDLTISIAAEKRLLRQAALPPYVDTHLRASFDEMVKRTELRSASPADAKRISEFDIDVDILLLWKKSEASKISQLIEAARAKGRYFEVDPQETRLEGSFYLWAGLNCLSNSSELIEYNKTKLHRMISEVGAHEVSYVFGTGPSLSPYCEKHDFSDGICIIANSIVKNEALLRKLAPKIIAAGDPIFHAGISQYAAEFRRSLVNAMRLTGAWFVCPLRDYNVYLHFMPEDLRDRIVAIPFDRERQYSSDLTIDFRVFPYANVLTLLLLPLASTLSTEIRVVGCDGRPLNEDKYFWAHDKAAQFNDEMENIKHVHPGFFSISYNDYYLEHCRDLEIVVSALEGEGRSIRAATPSHIPALKSRYALPPEHEGETPIALDDVPAPKETVIISIDPDAINSAGHYLHYDTQIAEACLETGIPVILFGRKDLDLDSVPPRFLATVPTFTVHSFSIDNKGLTPSNENIRTFISELENALDKTVSKDTDNDYVLYMYCGGIFSADAVFSTLKKWPNLRANINLFWTVYQDETSPEFASQWASKLRKMIESPKIQLTVQSEKHAMDLESALGIRLKVAPHPSTTFSDISAREMIEEQSLLGNSRPRVLFPGGLLEEKGFLLSAEAAKSLNQSGLCDIKVRASAARKATKQIEDAVSSLADAGVDLSRSPLDTDEFVELLRSSDIIVCPYLPPAFSRRTSGILIDAILLGKPLVVVEGTWLSDLVRKYGIGEVALPTATSICQCINNIIQKYKSYEEGIRTAQIEYLENNNWSALCRSITQISGHEFVDSDTSNLTAERPQQQEVTAVNIEEFPRTRHASVDETKVIAHLLRDRVGAEHVMLDVGAHFGTSASYYHRLDWTIYCFEPDSDNRAKLSARFKDAGNVRIDKRAVSDKPAKGVQFFTSEQSTGISGLHAFHESHAETGRVDITTLREVVADLKISKVDFLKIDVEGFDLNVLKGVPWDILKPDVIECEFEDAKTLKLGHDWKVVANYLTKRGYTVYVSEWHPIVRYGIPHDWKRVFRYEGQEIPDDAWGNLLAFRNDPGIRLVADAFEAVMSFRLQQSASPAPSTSFTPASVLTGMERADKPLPQSTTTKSTSKNSPTKQETSARKTDTRSEQAGSQESRADMLKQTSGYEISRESTDKVQASLPGKVWYFDLAHQIRSVSPVTFELLRFARRAMVHVMHSRILMTGLVAIAALVSWLCLDTRLGDIRPWLLISTAFGVLALVLTYVAARAYTHAASLHIETHDLKAELLRLREQVFKSAQVDKKLAIRDARIGEIRTSLEKAKATLEAHARTLGAQGDELKQIEVLSKQIETLNQADANLEAHRKSLDQTVDTVRIELGRVDSTLTQELLGTKESINHANTRIKEAADTATALSGQIAELETRLATIDKWSQFDNSRWYQRFNRRLNDQHIQTLEKEWRKRLSMPISQKVLGYMASRVCDIERRLDGRLATTVEDILLRTLVARAVKGKTLDVLEIGTLFATGAAIMYDSAAPHFDKVHFTLLDPLEGYYNQTQADILTGQVINEDVVRRNLARVGMSDDEFTLIKHLSTEPEAMEAASRKTYDVLIIDGDHSYAGVKADFENYASMVKLGGYIILDDYNSPDWPDVTDYVDKELAGHDFVSPVGASWRTCVYRVVKAPAKSGRTTPVMSPESATTPYLERQTKADDIH